MNMRKTLLIVAAVLIPAGVIGIGLAGRLMTPPASASAAATVQGPANPEPAVSGRGVRIQFSDKPIALPVFSIVDLDGKPMSSEAWRGKVVLVNFWATWCGYCVQEMPELVALQDRYRGQLIVVGLSTDTIPPDAVRSFAREKGLNYPVAIAGPDVQKAFGGISSLPSTFVVNPQGRIVQRHLGVLNPVLTEHEVRSLAGLPTDARVELVKDTGQVLLSNAAFATELPGVDLSGLTPAQKGEALKRLNTEKCTCGCGLTVAQCRINDPTCTVSPGIAAKIVNDVRRH
jgi:thiol-disulfide isomerase/thioredoxin